MIEKVDTNKIQSLLEKVSSRLPKTTADVTGDDAGVKIQVEYASFIDIAMKIPQNDSQKIENAKQLLLSGQLESPENIKKAAKNIINFGI